MNDLRREIKEGFAPLQSQITNMPPIEDRMLRTAKATKPASRRAQLWPSLTGVALVLIAAVVVGTAVVMRGLHPRSVLRHQPSPTPSVQPTAAPLPTAMANPLQVPATTPIIVFRDPVNTNQLDGMSWDGFTVGRLGAKPDSVSSFVPNAAGSLFGLTGQIVDRSGTVVAAVPNPTKGFQATWADDGQHYCAMVSAPTLGVVGGVPATLQVTQVGRAPRNVVQVGRAYEQPPIGVAACSIVKDQAVVVQSGGQGIGTAQMWVVRLSTGRVLWTKSYQTGTVDIHASIDAQYVAETPFSCCPMRATVTTIYSPNGTVLARVNGEVQAFSWDGSLAVVANYGEAVSIVRWRDGATIWRSVPSAKFSTAIPEPGGSRIAVSVLDPNHPQTGGFAPVDVEVVTPDGTARVILTNVT